MQHHWVIINQNYSSLFKPKIKTDQTSLSDLEECLALRIIISQSRIMAKSCGALFLLALIVLFMLQTTVWARNGSNNNYNKKRYGNGSLKIYQCPSECNRRCSDTQYHKACITFCNKCCRKCLCVPPGFYGHKELCSCYNNWKTQEGGPKCP